MLGSIGSIILLIIIVGCIVYWFVLKKQINEEDGDRIEPSIDSSFSEFSQKELPKDHEKDDYKDDYEEETLSIHESVKTDDLEKIKITSSDVTSKEKEVSKEEDDLWEEDQVVAEAVPKKSFFARLKTSLLGDQEDSSSSDEQSLARPAPIRTVALILKAPDDQPYLGQEVLEVGQDLKLMIGGEGFLQQIVTTYLGDEPMYSIAHMINPGSFNDPDILTMEIPGLIFFAQIPGPDAHMNTVQYMLKASAYFGQELGGTLLDEKNRPVDKEYIQKLLSDVSEIEQQAWAKHRAHR